MLRAPPAQENLRRQQQLPSTAANFIAGTVAAVGATLLTQPADVVRTRVQLGLAVAAGGGSGAARVGMLQLLRAIGREQGMQGLLAGAVPRIVKRTMQTALVWTLYEELYPMLSGAWARALPQDAAAPPR